MGFVLAGLVAACGIWADVAGPVGAGIRIATGVLIGSMRALAPMALVGIGIMLLRGPRPGDASVGEPEGGTIPGAGGNTARAELVLAVRLGVGTTLMLLSITSLLHITMGRPGVGDFDGLAGAGGALGLAVGGVLVAAMGVWGAVLVMIATGLLGTVVLTRVSLRAWARRVDGTKLKAGFSRIARSLSAKISGPVTPVDHDQGPGESEPSTPETVAIPTLPPEFEPESAVEVMGSEAEPEPAPGAGALGSGSDSEPAPSAGALGSESESESESGADGSPLESGPAGSRADPRWRAPTIVGDNHPVSSVWKLPPLDLLTGSDPQQGNQQEAARMGAALERALAAHDVDTKLVGMVVGPTVTRYELELAPGVKVSRVTSLSKDIAYAMASPDVRILAPIPGRRAIGVEVPNPDRQVVSLGGILMSDEARRAIHPLEVAIGRDINAKPVIMDLSRMPHILIAGATGAGKSSCINSMITSVLMRSTPDQVRMILIDPKMVEMAQYEHVPHLLTQPVTDPKKAANALAWACREMDRRYEILASVGVRDINGYNEACDRGVFERDHHSGVDDSEVQERMPLILVVVDELSDLMMVAPRDVEDSICRIAQKARAVGIHLVIATQRPSINVITGVIKANIPARLAFAVSSQTDSRVILDQQGAERLVGRGDMLLLSPTSTAAQRIQGAWVTEAEVRSVVAAWRRQDAAMGHGVMSTAATSEAGPGDVDPLAPDPAAASGNRGDEDDELLAQAMRLVVESGLGSTSMLQRKLRVGFARAGRLMDLLERRGVVGPSEGSKAREVLMSPDELT
ncbi:DNA translocase FtsK 4TM domain-containing protein [Candidatus Poriferisocius sp.]|uniref:DNA translocase FtsK 4TM domain-containing protein n=1 Tax=Candidatus Poriferisocius sp. TaxID=3101276 RepID=UPI003B02E8F5